MAWMFDTRSALRAKHELLLAHDPEDLQSADHALGDEKTSSSLARRPAYTAARSALLVVLGVLLGALASAIFSKLAPTLDSQRLPVPDLPTEHLVLTQDPLFSQPSSPESDAAWNTLLPTIRGLVVLDAPEQYDLPPGMTGTDGEAIYGLTWTHQYHCLAMVRAEFWRLLRNESNMVGAEDRASADDGLHHFKHCFDYLRQTMLCSLDMTVEFAARDPETGAWAGNIDGWGIPHTCKSREANFKWMEDHAVWV